MTTKPTIATILERITALDSKMDERISSLESKIDERISSLESKMDERFDRLDNEIDRVASVAYSTKAEMLTLRADFRELRAQLKEVLPVPQTS